MRALMPLWEVTSNVSIEMLELQSGTKACCIPTIKIDLKELQKAGIVQNIIALTRMRQAFGEKQLRGKAEKEAVVNRELMREMHRDELERQGTHEKLHVGRRDRLCGMKQAEHE